MFHNILTFADIFDRTDCYRKLLLF